MDREDVIEMAREAGFTVGYGSPALPKHEAFAKLIAKKVRFESADDAWIELVKHGVGWHLRKAVTDAIHARDKE